MAFGSFFDRLSGFYESYNFRLIHKIIQEVNYLRGKNSETQIPIKQNLIDPTIRENALRILNISNEESKNKDTIERKYFFLLSKLEEKKNNLPSLLAESVQQMIDIAKNAYQTLKTTTEEVEMSLTSNVLNTPLEIYDAVVKIFPKAKAEIQRTGDGFKLNLEISKIFPVLSLDKAVDAQELARQLNKIFGEIRFAKCSEEPVTFNETDIARFSLMEPLEDWQKYRRVMFEKEGRSCQGEIFKYLQGLNNLVVLDHLGLAPNQIEDLRVSDIEYFKEVLSKISNFASEDKKPMLLNFQRFYPKLYKKIFDDMVKKKHEEELKEKNNFFQDTLDKLRSRVFGQDQATESLASLLTTQSENFDENKVFIFAGPTGVGKTELAKAVSDIKNGRFVNFSMNQYQSDISISNFFGSGIGWVGSTDSPPLAKKLMQYSKKSLSNDSICEYIVENLVILFDEFEKAHRDIKQSLLTVFDEGYWSYEYSQRIDIGHSVNKNVKFIFKKCIIINTSNLYQDEILKAFEGKMKTEEIERMFKILNSTRPIRTSFSKELLGRTTVIPFGPIPKGECYRMLVKNKMTTFFKVLQEKIFCREIEIENEDLILKSIEDKIYGQGIDIRQVNRYLENVREAIFRIKSEWGKMQTKKLTFSHDGEKFFIKISEYFEGFDIYHELDLPLLILP